MKQIFILFRCLCFVAGIVSVAPATAQVNYATYVNLSRQINAASKPNGDVMVHTEKGRFRIFVRFRHRRITAIYAIDEKGNRLNAACSKLRQNCDVSFRSIQDNKLFSYDIDCSLMPLPAAAPVARRR